MMGCAPDSGHCQAILYPLAYAPACIAALQAATQPPNINYAVKSKIVKCEYCNATEFISFSHATPHTQNAVKMYKNAFSDKLLCYIYFPYIKCAWLCCEPVTHMPLNGHF